MSVVALLIAAISWMPVLEHGQMEQRGLAFDCALLPLASAATTITQDMNAPEKKVFIWFGRVLAVRKETRGLPIALTIDPEAVVSRIGRGYQASSTGPRSFVIKSQVRDGEVGLVVDGQKQLEHKPNHFRVTRALTTMQAGSRHMSGVLVGHCGVSADVPYSAYAAKRSRS